MNTLELAKMEELDACAALMEEGRAFQRQQGFVQWTPDYPNRETVREDIETGKGYVLKVDGQIAGYLCVDFDGEPAYENIQGRWGTPEPYAAAHRLALSGQFRGRGLTTTIFELVRELCLARGVTAIRGDTDEQNLRMQHVLEKCGFQRRGVIIFQGSEKLAYDWQLT